MPITADNISITPPSHEKSYFNEEIFLPVKAPRYTTRIFTEKVRNAVRNESAPRNPAFIPTATESAERTRAMTILTDIEKIFAK